MVGAGHRGAVVTHVDKASKFLVAGLTQNRTAQSINKVTTTLFEQLPEASCLTLTCDNGKEFTKHQEPTDALGAACSFATPYCSWERGLNKHTKYFQAKNP